MKKSLLLGVFLAGCSQPVSGPDKTVAGGLIESGIGAGAGALIGHQIGQTASGTAVGAGLGLVQGLSTGAANDLIEGSQLELQESLEATKAQNERSARVLSEIQARLDDSISQGGISGIYQVFFDSDQTNLRAGAIANLEIIADSIRRSPVLRIIKVVGHTDDSGNPKHNARLAQARARNVASYLMARGISEDQINISHSGADKPIASNSNDAGRQLNRRVEIFFSN